MKVDRFLACFFAIVASAAIAHAEVVCQTSTGDLVVRKKCKRKETKFSYSSVSSAIPASSGAAGPVGAQGPAGPVGAQGAQGVQGVSGVIGNTGPKGSRGSLDFSACRRVQDTKSNILNETISSLTGAVACDPFTEFLFNDQYVPTIFPGSGGTKVFVQARSTDYTNIAGETRPTIAYVTFVRQTVVGLGIYSINVEGLCCPR